MIRNVVCRRELLKTLFKCNNSRFICLHVIKVFLNLSAPLVPYGVECIRELFRFLVSLCNPNDKQNSEKMLHIGLTLLTVALEVGADSIGQYQTLLVLVKDDLCRNILSVSSCL